MFLNLQYEEIVDWEGTTAQFIELPESEHPFVYAWTPMGNRIIYEKELVPGGMRAKIGQAHFLTYYSKIDRKYYVSKLSEIVQPQPVIAVGKDLSPVALAACVGIPFTGLEVREFWGEKTKCPIVVALEGSDIQISAGQGKKKIDVSQLVLLCEFDSWFRTSHNPVDSSDVLCLPFTPIVIGSEAYFRASGLTMAKPKGSVVSTRLVFDREVSEVIVIKVDSMMGSSYYMFSGRAYAYSYLINCPAVSVLQQALVHYERHGRKAILDQAIEELLSTETVNTSKSVIIGERMYGSMFREDVLKILEYQYRGTEKYKSYLIREEKHYQEFRQEAWRKQLPLLPRGKSKQELKHQEKSERLTVKCCTDEALVPIIMEKLGDSGLSSLNEVAQYVRRRYVVESRQLNKVLHTLVHSEKIGRQLIDNYPYYEVKSQSVPVVTGRAPEIFSTPVKSVQDLPQVKADLSQKVIDEDNGQIAGSGIRGNPRVFSVSFSKMEIRDVTGDGRDVTVEIERDNGIQSLVWGHMYVFDEAVLMDNKEKVDYFDSTSSPGIHRFTGTIDVLFDFFVPDGAVRGVVDEWARVTVGQITKLEEIGRQEFLLDFPEGKNWEGPFFHRVTLNSIVAVGGSRNKKESVSVAYFNLARKLMIDFEKPQMRRGGYPQV